MSSSEFSAVTESVASLCLVSAEVPTPQEEEDQRSEETVTPRQAHFPPEEQAPETAPERQHNRKARKQSPHSGSETETEEHSNMPSGSSSKHHHHHHSSSSSSKKHGSSSSSKHQSKGDDWSEVTEPEERRRIQNRIAQRKFREKAREQKEREERESRNEQLAGSSYQVPVPEDFMSPEGGGEYGDYLSGVPWGGVSIQHMVAMGHESESRRGSRRGGLSDQQQQYDYSAFYDPQLYDAQLGGGYGGGGGGAGAAADDSNRYFDALSTSGSSPSYLSFDSGSGYDNFSGDNSSSSGARY